MANNFSADPSCKALWRFEPGALLADSKGGNTLEDWSDPGFGPASETTAGLYREGSGSVETDYNSGMGEGTFLGINDANLDAGFPLKDGDAAKLFSMAGWFRFAAGHDDSGQIGFVSKAVGGANVFYFGHAGGGEEYYLRVYHSGGNQVILTTGAGLQLERWFHFGLAIDGISKTYLIRSYDAVADTAQTFSGSFTNELQIGASHFRLFTSSFAGLFDEFVVFDELKDADDFDAIRQGAYPPFDGTLLVDDAYNSLRSTTLWQVDIEMVDDAYHAHTAPNLTLGHVAGRGSTLQPDGFSHPNLPALKSSGEFGQRMNTIPGLRLPGLSLFAATGAVLSRRLPEITLASSMASGQTIRLSKKLPALAVEARTGLQGKANLLLPGLSLESRAGIRSSAGILPGIRIEAEISGGLIGRLSKTLPMLSLEAGMSTPVVGRLNRTLPALELDASISWTVHATLDRKLPALMLEAQMLGGGAMVLDAVLSDIRLEASGGGRSMFVDALLPALIVQPSAATGHATGVVIYLADRTRFTDYVLRHVR